MTLIQAMIQRKASAGYLLADMAATVDGGADDGCLAYIGPKMFICGGGSGVIAATGSVHYPALELALVRYQKKGLPFLKSLPDIALDMLRHINQDSKVAACGLLAMVWDRQYNQALFAGLATDGECLGEHFPGPMAITMADAVCFGGTAPETVLGRPIDVCNPASFDPRVDGVTMFDAIRRVERFEEYGTPAFRIGGGVQLATVTAKGAKIETIHTWAEDKVGQRIQPKGAQ